ncbi:MAG: hypothetical protein OXI96_05435 [Acidimicrobiaceae bacterium]|nr:hypothetical protein [Acidimicrobiaceae bacterium]
MYNIFDVVDELPYHTLELIADRSYEQALALEKRAAHCRAVARIIDVRRNAITKRHLPAVELHNEQVWKGQAATVSRERLRQTAGMQLHTLDRDLAATSRAILLEAADLEQKATMMYRQSRLAEEAASAMLHKATTS